MPAPKLGRDRIPDFTTTLFHLIKRGETGAAEEDVMKPLMETRCIEELALNYVHVQSALY